VSPAVDLQNLEEFGDQEGHQLEFQISGVWKSWKIRIRARPTCQARLPLNRWHRSPVRARDTAHGDVAVTVRARWPSPTSADPTALSARSRGQEAFSSSHSPSPLYSTLLLLRLRRWAPPSAASLFDSPRPQHPLTPLTLLPCAGAPEGAQSRYRASALPATTPFTGDSLALHAVFQSPWLEATSHLSGHFSTGLEARGAVVCRNHPRRWWAHSLTDAPRPPVTPR
jgi:hypothetical protein